jgi:putative membrane protein
MAAARMGPWAAKLVGASLMAAALGGPARAGLAHPGQPPAPHDLWQAWNLEPVILVSLGVTAWVYARGRRARQPVPAVLSFAAGLLVLAAALISPIDALGSALFAGHMFQHMLLILVAAPLLVLGAPLGPLLVGLPRAAQLRLGQGWHAVRGLRAAAHGLTQPLVVWALHTLVFWAWHAPGLYQAALRSQLIHGLEHLSLLGTALLFWWAVLPARGARPAAQGLAVLLLFTMALQSGLLGALITFAPEPWYETYRASTAAWGLTPLEDQQLAGASMWVASGAAYLLAALVVFAAWLNRIERAGQRASGIDNLQP